MPADPPPSPFYRIDKFAVPDGSLQEFRQLVDKTHVILQAQSGLLDDVVLERVGGPSRFNIGTVARWSDRQSYEAAVEAVLRFHDSIGFDRASIASRLGIEADIGLYRA